MKLVVDLEFNIAEDLLNRKTYVFPEKGSYTIMLLTAEIEEQLKEHYGVEGLALKVFNGRGKYKILVTDPEWIWGAVTLERATIIQNLFASEQMAPRVYGFASVNGFVAQVVEYISPTDTEITRITKLENLLIKYGIKTIQGGDYGGWWNWRDGKFVDFSHLDFIVPAAEPLEPRESVNDVF